MNSSYRWTVPMAGMCLMSAWRCHVCRLFTAEKLRLLLHKGYALLSYSKQSLKTSITTSLSPSIYEFPPILRDSPCTISDLSYFNCGSHTLLIQHTGCPTVLCGDAGKQGDLDCGLCYRNGKRDIQDSSNPTQSTTSSRKIAARLCGS